MHQLGTRLADIRYLLEPGDQSLCIRMQRDQQRVCHRPPAAGGWDRARCSRAGVPGELRMMRRSVPPRQRLRGQDFGARWKARIVRPLEHRFGRKS